MPTASAPDFPAFSAACQASRYANKQSRIARPLNVSEIPPSHRMVTVRRKLFQRTRVIPAIILKTVIAPHVVKLNPVIMVDCDFRSRTCQSHPGGAACSLTDFCDEPFVRGIRNKAGRLQPPMADVYPLLLVKALTISATNRNGLSVSFRLKTKRLDRLRPRTRSPRRRSRQRKHLGAPSSLLTLGK